jgi:hypothetical protein
MKKPILPLIATALVLLSACIPSVHPFYTDEDLAFDSRLLASWGPKGDASKERWAFTAADAKTYHLEIIDNEGKTGEFEAHLFKLGQHLFLDLTPRTAKPDPSQADLVQWSLIPGHLLARVYQIEPTFKMAMVDFKWLEGFLKANPSVLAHRISSDALVVLTAGTQQLQQFVLAHLGADELFKSAEDSDEMERKTDQPPKSPAAPRK